MITWITENIAIGEYLDAINVELLKREKIDCVLNVRSKVDTQLVEETITMELGIQYAHVAVGEEYPGKDYFEKIKNFEEDMKRTEGMEFFKIQLRAATYMLELLSKKYKRILVHCTAGIDRAPFVLAYWLSDKIDWALDLDTNFDFNIRKAYSFIKKKRPQIVEHLEWI